MSRRSQSVLILGRTRLTSAGPATTCVRVPVMVGIKVVTVAVAYAVPAITLEQPTCAMLRF